jgi:predicted transcriptional regulator
MNSRKTIKPEPKTSILSGTQSITVRVRKKHVRALDALAERRGTERSAQIQQAIADYVERNQEPQEAEP